MPLSNPTERFGVWAAAGASVYNQLIDIRWYFSYNNYSRLGFTVYKNGEYQSSRPTNNSSTLRVYMLFR